MLQADIVITGALVLVFILVVVPIAYWIVRGIARSSPLTPAPTALVRPTASQLRLQSSTRQFCTELRSRKVPVLRGLFLWAVKDSNLQP